MSEAPPNGVAAGRPDADALRCSEQRYRALVEAGSGIVWTWTPADGIGEVARVQRWWEDVTGQPPEEQSRDRVGWLHAVHPDDRAAAAAAWGGVLTQAGAYDVEYRLRNRNGGWCHVHSRAVPVRGPGGEVREWVGAITDVTDARRATAERERLLREVEAERRKLAEVFHHAPSFMCVLRGPTHVFERANARYLEVIGRGGGDLIGRPVREAVPEVEGQGFFELLDRVYATGEPYVGTDVPITLRRGGVLEERYLDLVYQPLRDPDGAVTGIIVQGVDLTDRKRAEDARARAVGESERQRRMFDTALSNSADYIYLIGTDGRFAYANKALLDLWRIDASQVAGKSFLDLGYEPGLASRLERQVQEVVRTGGPVRDEAPVTNESGTRFYEYIFMPVFGTGGEVEAVAGSTRDTTERKAAETALRASEERYRWLLDVLPVAVFVHDGAAIAFCNPAFVRLMGAASAADLLGADPFARVHPDDHAQVHAKIEKLTAAAHKGGGMELTAVRLDGRAVPVFCVSAILPGRARPSFLVVWTDLTERERSAQMLRSVLDSVGDSIVTTDEGGAVLAANPAAVRTFGCPEPALVGKSVRDLLPGATWGAEAPPGTEVEGRRRGGGTFPAELTVTEFRFDGERRFTAVVRDITARKALEAEFRQAQKMEAFGKLAGGVAHDFNNLLTVINGYSAMFLKERPAGHPDAEAMAEILAAGKRAEDLTRQLLAFGRRQVLQPKELDPNELVANLLKMLGRLLGEDVQLVTALGPSPGTVRADPGQLEQVVVNLCVNARDAMPTGGRLTISTAAVEVRDAAPGRPPAVPPGRYTRLAVADTGRGMTDAVRAKVFEPFFTTKPVGEGTGLGLSTVFGIVEQSGGHITVSTAVGRGTTFEVYLPVVDSPPAERHPAGPDRPLPGGPETVLLVEDERSVRKLTAMLLRNAGYRVLEAGGGEEAARAHAAAGGDVQLLLTDVVMPRESGRELAERLTRASPGLRVLFMSGYTDDRVMRHGILSSEVAFIQKPFDVGALLGRVREMLDRPAG